MSVLIKDRTGSTSVRIALRATHIAFQVTIGRTRDINKGRAETASRLGARFSKRSWKLPGQGWIAKNILRLRELVTIISKQ